MVLNKKLLALGLASATLVGAAQAGNFYVGGDVGHAKGKSFCSSIHGTDCHDSDTVYSLFGGYDLDQYVGFQAGYSDLGKLTEKHWANSGKVTFQAYSFDLAVIGRVPLTDAFSLYGKGGASYYDTRIKIDNFGSRIYSKDAAGWSPVLGAGVQWNLGSIALLAGLERMWDVGDKKRTGQVERIDQFNVGLKFPF